MNKQHAFTLAEVLIALALLGVVAAFTIPKIMQSQGEAQKKLLLKETVGTISGIFYTGSLKKELPYTATQFGPYHTYLFDRINTTYKNTGNLIPDSDACKSNVAAEGPCLIMGNGVTIQALDDGSVDVGSPIPEEIYYVDYNGKNPPNNVGDDELLVWVQFYPTQNKATTTRAWAMMPENVTLWNKVFQ